MQIRETIKEYTVQSIVGMLCGTLSYFFLSVYSELIPKILPMLQNWPNTLLLKISIVAIILCVLSWILTLFVSLKLKNKLIPKFGVKWDKNHEAYCASCEIPLSDSNADGNDHYFTCVKCNKTVTLTHLGKRITLPEALKILNNKK